MGGSCDAGFHHQIRPRLELPAVAAPPPTAVNISFFCEALAPCGNWIQVDGAQYWQPSAAEPDLGWQPHCQRGHRVNSDCGWAWYSAGPLRGIEGWVEARYGMTTVLLRLDFIGQAAAVKLAADDLELI